MADWWWLQRCDEVCRQRIIERENPYDICEIAGEEFEPCETTWINVFTRQGDPYLCALMCSDNETMKLYWAPYNGAYPSPYIMERVG